MDTPGTLAADMLKAAGEAIVGTRAIVQKSAYNVKTDARKNVAQSAPIHNAHAQYTITYDTKIGVTSIEAEIGYDRDVSKAANLAWVLEYGGGKDHSPPHRDVGRALDVEEPRFEEAITKFAGKLL